MSLTTSELRENIYQVFEEILETGVPIEVTLKGRVLKIVPSVVQDKFENIQKRDIIVGDPEDLVHIDWSQEW